jgi:tetratricopeptide (TPR) repeat protein
MKPSTLIESIHGRSATAAAESFPRDAQLLEFFTNVQHLVDYFELQLDGHEARRPILILHGVGGIGKSSLLGKLRSLITKRGFPIAAVAGETVATPVDILRSFAVTMRRCGFPCLKLEKMLKAYDNLQLKVDKERSKLPHAILTGGGAAAGAVLGGNPAVGAAAGNIVSAGFDWLRGFFSKPDVELFTNPTTALTRAFVEDLEKIRQTAQCVVMIDTYENLGALDGWILNLVSQIHHHAFVIVAGRNVPNWDRDWQGWMKHARIEELSPMSDESMRLLIDRYCRAINGDEIHPEDMRAIVHFSRGLPLVVTTAVSLFVKFKFKRFEEVRPRVMRDLVDRVFEGVPSNLRQWLEAAAILRWFDKPLLNALLELKISEVEYQELSSFPFARPHKKNLMIHDSIREAIDENFRIQDPARHAAMHLSAAKYFSDVDHNTHLDSLPRRREWLYHEIKGNPTGGTLLLRKLFDDLVESGVIHDLRAALSDAASIDSVPDPTKRWILYYTGRVLQLEGKFAEAVAVFENIGVAPREDIELFRYTNAALASILARWDRLGDAGSRAKVLKLASAALSGGKLDSVLSAAVFARARANAIEGQWTDAVSGVSAARDYFKGNLDLLGFVRAQNELQSMAVLQGRWGDLITLQDEAIAQLTSESVHEYLRARTEGYWSWGLAVAGQSMRAEEEARASIAISKKQSDNPSHCIYARNHGWALFAGGKYEEGLKALLQSLAISEDLGPSFREVSATTNAIIGMVLTSGKEYKDAADRLNSALRVKTEIKDVFGMPDTLLWRAQLSAAIGDFKNAIAEYNTALEWSWTGRAYCDAEARLGLCQSLYLSGAIIDTIDKLPDAISTGRQYHDLSAWLYVLQGQLQLDGHIPESVSDAPAESYFGRALIDALLHSPITLESVLKAISAACSANRSKGQLSIAKVRDFWSSAKTNYFGYHTITQSSAEPLPLFAFEALLRERYGMAEGAASVQSRLDLSS